MDAYPESKSCPSRPPGPPPLPTFCHQTWAVPTHKVAGKGHGGPRASGGAWGTLAPPWLAAPLPLAAPQLHGHGHMQLAPCRSLRGPRGCLRPGASREQAGYSQRMGIPQRGPQPPGERQRLRGCPGPSRRPWVGSSGGLGEGLRREPGLHSSSVGRRLPPPSERGEEGAVLPQGAFPNTAPALPNERLQRPRGGTGLQPGVAPSPPSSARAAAAP